MRRHGHDRDRGLAQGHRPADRCTMASALDVEAGGDLVGDRRQDGEGHRLVRLVVERLDVAAGVAGRLGLLARGRRPGRDPGPPRNPTAAPSSGVGQPVGQLARGSPARTGRRLADARTDARLGGPVSVVAPPDTGGIIATSSPSVEDRVARPRRRRSARTGPSRGRAPGPGGARRAPSQASATSAPAGQLDARPRGRRPARAASRRGGSGPARASARRPAAPTRDEQPVADRQDGRLEPRVAEHPLAERPKGRGVARRRPSPGGRLTPGRSTARCRR